MLFNSSRVVLKLGLLIPVFLTLAACNGTSTFDFSSHAPYEILGQNPESNLNLIFNYKTSTELSPSVTEWPDQKGLSQKLEVAPGQSFPNLTTVSQIGTKALQFDPVAQTGLFASGLPPMHITDKITFLLVVQLESNGEILRYGSDSNSDTFILSKVSGRWSLQHFTSNGNYRARTYEAAQNENTWNILGVVVGSSPKDLELYINGIRVSDLQTDYVGTAATYTSVLRHLNVGAGSSSAKFSVSQILGFKEKLTPLTMYQYSRYLGEKANIQIAKKVSLEIRRNIIPPVEPENVDYTYLNELIFKTRCISCHTEGSNPPRLDTYQNLINGTNKSGQKVITLGDAENSSFYRSVLNNSMPQGGTPLTDLEKSLIKTWIDNNTPEGSN